MELTEHARAVNDYYDIHTEPFYIGETGWDPEHLHFGIFNERPDDEYRTNPLLVLQDRKPAIERMTARTLGPAQLKPDDLVVDAGCGVGGAAILIGKNYGSTVVGLNINEMQLELAERRAKEAGVEDRVSFKFADCAVELPFEDSSVDAIVYFESVCHFAEHTKFISECGRILKTGGRLVGEDWMAASGISDADRTSFLEPLERTWLLGRLDTLDGYRKLLDAAGLDTIESECVEEGIRPNGYLIGSGYVRLAQKEQEEGLTDYERGNIDRLKSFADALLGGSLKIGRYAAVKH